MSSPFRHPELVEGSVLSDFRKLSAVIGRYYRGILFLTSIIALAACSKDSSENFHRIHKGMTCDEVIAILGKPTGPVMGGGSIDAHWKSWSYKHGAVVFVHEKVDGIITKP